MKMLVRYTPSPSNRESIPQTINWDTESLLRLGHPSRFVLEKRGAEVIVHDFGTPAGSKLKLPKIALNDSNYGKVIPLGNAGKNGAAELVLTPAAKVPGINWELVKSAKILPLLEVPKTTQEDTLYKKLNQRIGAGAAILLLLILLWPKGEEPKVEEELVPEKYAKLILTKPKPLKQPAAGSVSQSSAQVKAVARAFQSKSVRQNMQAILKGGLSKYSVMATGKSIQALSSTLQNQLNQTGAALQGKASDLLGANNVGAFKLGSETGYGAGGGLGVKGQGTGTASIGLAYGDATVEEGLTKEEVAKVIHAHMSEIRFCYESAIVADPTIAGKVMIDFKINAQGRVATAAVGESSLSSRQVQSCLVGKLRSWQFPQPRGGVNVAVSYPFIFKALSR